MEDDQPLVVEVEDQWRGKGYQIECEDACYANLLHSARSPGLFVLAVDDPSDFYGYGAVELSAASLVALRDAIDRVLSEEGN